MSWKAWTESGYGYPLFNDSNFRTVINFIAQHQKNDSGVINAVDAYDAYEYLDQSCAEEVADIINRLECYNVFRGYCSDGDTNQEEYIGVEPMYSWNMGVRDISLTKEKANEILVKYANLLGIEETPEYFDAYYCG